MIVRDWEGKKCLRYSAIICSSRPPLSPASLFFRASLGYISRVIVLTFSLSRKDNIRNTSISTHHMGHIIRLHSQTSNLRQAHNHLSAYPASSLIPRTAMSANDPSSASPALSIWWQGTVSDYIVGGFCVGILTLSVFYGLWQLVTVCKNWRGAMRSRLARARRGDVEALTEAVGRVIGREGERF